MADAAPPPTAPASLPRRWDATGVPLLLARLAVGGTFSTLALAKLQDPVGFLKLVHQYGLVPTDPPWLLNGLAVSLPWIELTCGALLLLGVALRGSALVAAGMLVVFTFAVASRALEIQGEQGGAFCAIAFDCGCGTGVVPVCPKLAENVGLLLLSGLVLWSRSARFCLRRQLV
jgi:uncharacterized membrane protein YphA (DoxX/SURF4 family)